MQAQETVSVQCPFCCESIELLLDLSSGSSQSYVYDCEVCCRAIQIIVHEEGGRLLVEAERAYE